jgi:hypothetical protein
MSASLPDLEALLVALVLAPATYSRNRFFELYTDASARRIRRRASLVRSIVRHLAPLGAREPGAIEASTTTPSGRVELTYTVSSLGLRRTTTLDPLEAALIRYVMARARSGDAGRAKPPESDGDQQRIEAALRRLAPAAVQRSAYPADRHAPVEQDPIA